jgi:2'-deoxynucleoside 5'-phosphate N-hydrolase
MSPYHRAFLSFSYQHRHELRAEIACIIGVLARHNLAVLDFANTYRFDAGQEREMMRAALAEIRQSDLLIAEASHKAIGIGIEIGYAIALNIRAIYVRKATAEYSTTVGGVASATLVYSDLDDLEQQLANLLASSE